MALYWDGPDGDRELPHEARVTRAMQAVQQALRAGGRQQGANVGDGHDRHGAPSPWRLSSEIHSETLGEGGSR